MPKASETFPENYPRKVDHIDIYWIGDSLQKQRQHTDATIFFEPPQDSDDQPSIEKLKKAQLMAQYAYQKLQEYGHRMQEETVQEEDCHFCFTVDFSQTPDEQERANLIKKLQTDLDIICDDLKCSPAIYNPERAAWEAFITQKLDMYIEIKEVVNGDANRATRIMEIIERNIFPDGPEKPKESPRR